MGLAVAEGIVSQHGGTITAGNRPEGGACIEVRFPVAHNHKTAARATAVPEQKLNG